MTLKYLILSLYLRQSHQIYPSLPYENPFHNVTVALEHIKTNLNKIYNSFQLKSLVHRFGDGPGMRTLNMTLSSVAANVEWVSRSQSAIFNWVEVH